MRVVRRRRECIVLDLDWMARGKGEEERQKRDVKKLKPWASLWDTLEIPWLGRRI